MNPELCFLHCGDGDTILIGGGDEWALVDANLTPPTQRRLEKMLRERNIRGLRFVCVTHFDTDHIRGLGKFLTRFFRETDSSRNVTWNIEQVILPLGENELMPLLYATKKDLTYYLGESADSTRAVRELIEMLNNMTASVPKNGYSKVTSYAPLERLTAPDKAPKPRSLGPWDVWFLGPRSKTITQYWAKFGMAWNLTNWKSRGRPMQVQRSVGENAISQILALCHRDTGETVLLTGDSTEAELEAALGVLTVVMEEAKRPPKLPFRLVKSSHHGAWTTEKETNSHNLNLYQAMCHPDRSVIVIPCLGNYGHHPSERVLQDFSEIGLPSRLTGEHPQPERSSRLKVSFVPGRPVSSSDSDLLDISAVFGATMTVTGGRDGTAYLGELRVQRAKHQRHAYRP